MIGAPQHVDNNFVDREGGNLWRLSMPNSAPFIIYGLIRTNNSDIATFESNLNPEFQEVLLETRLILTELPHPLQYIPPHLPAPLKPKPKSVIVTQQPPLTEQPRIRNLNELFFAPHETTCCPEHFTMPDSYPLLCKILQSYHFIITDKHPSLCSGKELNLSYVATTDLFITLMMIALSSGVKHYEEIIISTAASLKIPTIGVNNPKEQIQDVTNSLSNFQFTIELFIDKFSNEFLQHQLIEDEEEASYRRQIEEYWLLKDFRAIQQLPHPLEKQPLYRVLSNHRNEKYIQAALQYLHQPNTLMLVDIEHLNNILTLFANKGAKLTCVNPMPRVAPASPVMTHAYELHRHQEASSSQFTHQLSPVHPNAPTQEKKYKGP